jgi:hypothetical protein
MEIFISNSPLSIKLNREFEGPPDLLLQIQRKLAHKKRLRASGDTKSVNLIGNSHTIGNNGNQQDPGWCKDRSRVAGTTPER